jgi:type IV pilus modification protein PilV
MEDMAMNSKNFLRVRGFSLIEVLVAVVVLSFGLLALAALQSRLIQASSDAKAQSVALALAKDKLEEMRGYKSLSAASCGSGYSGFNCIASNNDTVTDSGGNVGGVDFTRSWTVKRYQLRTATGAFCLVGSAGCAAPFAPNSEFKTVDIRVGWTDSTGQSRVVAMEDAIAGLDPADTARNQVNRGGRSRGPKVVIYDPSTDAGVIPIAVGDGSETAATNPKPVNVSRTGDDAIETRFDVLTYAAISGGNTALAQSKVETSVVGCTCSQTGASTQGYRPTYWNGYRYTPPKLAPTTTTVTATNATQSRYCTVCCRDHQDPSGTTGPKFSPRRSAHIHYRLDNANTLVIAGPGEDYLEACRLIRVDGIFDVAADLSNDYYNLLPTTDNANQSTPSEADPPGDYVTAYQNFVLSYLTARYVTPNPSVGQEGATFNNRTSPSPATTAGTTLDRTTIPIASTDTKWLHSRGLYIDYLEPEALNRIGDAKANCVQSPATPTAAQLRDCVLRVLPFTSINLTELADWTPVAGQQIKVTATSDFSDSINFTDPIRGKVTPGTNPTPNASQDASTFVASSNSGVAVMPDINPDDVASESETNMKDSQTFQTDPGGGGGPAGGTFTYIIGGGPSTVSDTGYIYAGRADVCGGNPITCATRQSETLPAPVTVRIGNYNKAFSGVDGDQITNPCQTNKSTNMDYRAVYDVTNIAVTDIAPPNSPIVITTPYSVVHNNMVGTFSVGEYTQTLITSIGQGDAVTFTLGAPTYRCPINQPGNFNTSTQCGGSGNHDPAWDWGADGTGAVCASGGGTSQPNNP